MKRFMVPVIALYMLLHGMSIAQIASIAVISRVVALALEVPSGMVSDALGHKRVLLLAQIAKALSSAMLLLGTYEWFLFGITLFWAANAFVSGTREALFYERLVELGRKDEYRLHEGRAVGIGQFIGIASMALAGIAFTINPDLPIIITVVQFLVAFAVMVTFQSAKPIEKVKEKEGYFTVFVHFREATRLFKQHPSLLWISLLQALVVGTVFGAAEVLQPVLELVGLSAVAIGFYYAAERLLTSIAGFSLSAISRRYSESAITTTYTVLTLLSLGLFVVTDSALAIAAMLLIANAGATVTIVLVSNHINHTIPSGSRATAISMSSILFSLGIALTAAGIGLLSHAMDLRITIGVIALTGLVAAYPFVLRGYLHSSRA